MKDANYVDEIIKCCSEREQILIRDGSIRNYNKYFDKMRFYARKLINENRQEELLPYLNCDSISFQKDIAGLLYNCYPKLCAQKLQEIANMTTEAGLPKHFILLSVAAKDNLKYGIPKDFP